MKKLQLAVELCYDDEIYHGDDEDSIEWFNTDIIGKGDKGLALHSDEVGDRVGDITVLGSLAEIRQQERERCVKIIKSLKSPYPLDLMPSKLLPTKQEKMAWKFGDLVFNNTKNDILDLIYYLGSDSPKPKGDFGIDIIKELK